MGKEIKHYKEYDVLNLFKSDFKSLKSVRIDLATSFNLKQNFLVTLLKRNIENSDTMG